VLPQHIGMPIYYLLSRAFATHKSYLRNDLTD